MASIRRPEIGSTISIQKSAFDTILIRLREAGYQTIGPRIKNETLVYEPFENLSQLPQGYTSEQDAGREPADRGRTPGSGDRGWCQ